MDPSNLVRFKKPSILLGITMNYPDSHSSSNRQQNSGSGCDSSRRSISIFGAGAWGSALAHAIRGNGTSVTLWNRTPKPGTTSLLKHAAPPECEMILAIAVQHALSVCGSMLEANITPRICWIASKGLDSATGTILSTGISSYFPHCIMGVLSGPNIAREIEDGLGCGMTMACADEEVLVGGKALFSNTSLGIQTCQDVVGVQWWGALKNVMAIGYGLLQQSAVGHNMSATFLTLSTQEIAAIVHAKGGKSSTALSFAGIGDLILTSHCPAGRNRAYGQLFPQSPKSLVEGLDTLRAFQQHTLGSPDWTVPTPIIQSISMVLDGSLSIEDFPKAIMAALI